jgi:hypothetical protein
LGRIALLSCCLMLSSSGIVVAIETNGLLVRGGEKRPKTVTENKLTELW